MKNCACLRWGSQIESAVQATLAAESAQVVLRIEAVAASLEGGYAPTCPPSLSFPHRSVPSATQIRPGACTRTRSLCTQPRVDHSAAKVLHLRKRKKNDQKQIYTPTALCYFPPSKSTAWKQLCDAIIRRNSVGLLDSTLLPREIEILDSMAGLLASEKKLRAFVRSNLENYAQNVGYSGDNALAPYEITRLLSSPGKRSYRLCAMFYDFVINEIPMILSKYKFEELRLNDEIQKTLSELVDQRPNFREGVNAISNVDIELDISNQLEAIPYHWCTQYFGYRRSSRIGEIVRFYLSISPVPGNFNKVSFTNEFIRRDVHWRVRGAGFYINSTLYLSGHAVRIKDSDPSSSTSIGLGLRFFALRPYGNAGCLAGLVSSVNSSSVPIAARVLLVPAHQHKFVPAQTTSKAFSLSKVQDIIRNSPDYQEKIIGEIGHLFDKPGVFLDLIRNYTGTVLKSEGRRDSEVALSRLKIADIEQEIYEYCQENELNIEDILESTYLESLMKYKKEKLENRM